MDPFGQSVPSLVELVSLTGRVAVVTGAGAGIGAAIARRLAEAGAEVVVADLDPDNAIAVADEITAACGGRSFGWGVDVAESASVEAAADAAVSRLGRLDIWVNNAGIYPATGPMIDVTDDFLDRMLVVNVRGTVAGCRAAAHRMNGSGVIVNLSSTNGLRGGAGVGAYVASKHAVEGVTKTLGLELAGVGIRVVAVAPGLVDSPGVRAGLDDLAASGVDVSAGLGDNPLGRTGTPDDVARVVLFAASDLAAHVTGTTIVVDAGRTAR